MSHSTALEARVFTCLRHSSNQLAVGRGCYFTPPPSGEELSRVVFVRSAVLLSRHNLRTFILCRAPLQLKRKGLLLQSGFADRLTLLRISLMKSLDFISYRMSSNNQLWRLSNFYCNFLKENLAQFSFLVHLHECPFRHENGI